jgi:hypothetical protein
MNGEEGSVRIFIFLQILQLLRSKVRGKMNAQERIDINGVELHLENCTSSVYPENLSLQTRFGLQDPKWNKSKPHSQIPNTVYVLEK